MAGGGEVIPNGSIHWNITHANTNTDPYDEYAVQGVDPTPVADVRKYETDHPGMFKVVLRWNSVAEAQAALSGAMERGVGEGSATFFITPNSSVNREAARGDFPNPYAQLRIEW